jgi:hypothetical protein
LHVHNIFFFFFQEWGTATEDPSEELAPLSLGGGRKTIITQERNTFDDGMMGLSKESTLTGFSPAPPASRSSFVPVHSMLRCFRKDDKEKTTFFFLRFSIIKENHLSGLLTGKMPMVF